MLTIPAIAAAIMIGERRLQSLEGHIRAAQDSLAHVIEAVDHVPVVVVFEGVVGREARVDGDNGVQAVQLVCHGGCKDGGVGPDDGRGQVVVGLRVWDGLEAHALWEELIPGAQH